MPRGNVLKERARKLAVPFVQKEDDKSIELLVFELASDLFAVETQAIKEIFPLKELTPLPGAPPFLYGLMNVRRKILPVIHLNSLFGLPPVSSAANKVIILEDEEKELAIVMDELIGIQTVEILSVQPPLATFNEIKMELIRGVTLSGIAIIDAKIVLASRKLQLKES